MPNHASDSWVSVVTWIVVAIGWFVVHSASLARERRSEKRDEAKGVVTDLRELEKEASDFHGAESFDEFKASNLTLKCDRLIKVLQRVPFNELKLDPALLSALRRSITCNNIDRTAFEMQSANSETQRNIRIATDDLIDAVEIAKARYWT